MAIRIRRGRQGRPRSERSLADRVRARPPSAGELAWLILELLAVGELAKAQGWCLGALRPGNLAVSEERLLRASRDGPLRRAAAMFRARQHRRAGHDPWCAELGIARAHLWRLVRELQPPDGGWLILEAVEAAWGDLSTGSASFPETPRECVEYRVRERITPVPWLGPEQGSVPSGQRASALRPESYTPRRGTATQTHDAVHPNSGARHRRVA